MAIQPADELRMVDARHVRFLGRHEQMIIAGLYVGWSAVEMGELFGCSEPTVARVRRRAVEAVFDLTELEGTPALLRLWGERHRACCTAGAFEMIENNRLESGW